MNREKLEVCALDALTRSSGAAGSTALNLSARFDLLRSVGSRYYLRRLRRRGSRGLPAGARDVVYREIWTDAAERIGAEVSALGSGFLEIRRGDVATRVSQQVVALDDPVTLRIALDKPLVHARLRELGIPVADHVEFEFSDPAPALEFLRAAGGPCVLKPASGTGGGYGTTAGIDSTVRLMRARLATGKPGSRLLLERQVEGVVYRLLFLDGELIDVLRHRPPRVTGDGHSTVEQLIAAENARRVRANGSAGLSLLGVCLDTIFALERLGLGLGSVLAEDRTVAVQTVTNNNRVEDTETVTSEVAPELAAEARTAAEAVGLRLAGVDVITPDGTRSLRAAGGIVAEVNGSPGIHHHYHVANPTGATPVATAILERVLEAASRTEAWDGSTTGRRAPTFGAGGGAEARL